MTTVRALDLIGVGLLVMGGLCVASGILPATEAGATLQRIVPLLLFLGAVVVLADLTARAGVFDVVATRVAVLGRGSYPRLFLLVVGLASLTTVTLNLDTTAVLLTPIMLALAARTGIAPVPLAVTTVWLANTASLLLPVSNLTNLLAVDRLDLGTVDFGRRMLLPQIGALAVTTALLWWFYWRRTQRHADHYVPPDRHVVQDGALCRLLAAACTIFVAGVVSGLSPGLVSAVAAGLAVGAFAWRDRGALRFGLVPWRLLVTVVGLFLVIQTASFHGLESAAAAAIGNEGGVGGMYRTAVAGGVLANVVNNLPAYAALEGAVPETDDSEGHLLALLVGTNVAPVVTPWASLATLLWYERCGALGVKIRMGRLVATGAVLAVSCVAVAVPLVR
jgi:arsenical pump membrane protein